MAERFATLGRALVEADEIATSMERRAKLARQSADEAERAFWNAMNDADQTTGTWELGEPYGKVQFTKRETIRAKVLDKTTALKAIREANLDDELIENESIRQGPLADRVRASIREGTPLMKGVDFTPTRYVTITKKGDT